MKNLKFPFYQAYENIVITGAGSEATDLTGPAPTYTATIAPESYMFDDILTVNFDAKEGKVATRGWINQSETKASELIKSFSKREESRKILEAQALKDNGTKHN